MRGITRAAAYLPAYSDGRRRLAGWDEDAFTLAATALERAVPRAGPPPEPLRLHLWGAITAAEAAPLQDVLGRPIEIEPVTNGSLDELQQSLKRSTGPEWLVVVARDRGDSPAAGSPAPGEGAVALLVDEAEGARPLSALSGRAATPAHADASLSTIWPALRAEAAASGWPGDWDAAAEAGRKLSGPRTASPEVGRVSQGAFVSVPRDEEARPGRWRFVADRCGACHRRTFPPRGRCRHCGHRDGLVPEPLPLEGATVVATTWIGPGGQPTEFDEQVEATGAYGVVLAQIEPDVTATLSVADAEPAEVAIGARVDSRLRRLYALEGAWRYGRKAVPSRRPSAG